MSRCDHPRPGRPVGSTAPGRPARRSGSWSGLGAHRASQRITQLAHAHFDDTAASLKQAVPPGGQEPVVLGGREEAIPAFLAVLPDDLRDRFAGSFAADPHAVTPERIRDLSAAVVENWVSLRRQRMVAQVLGEPPDGRTAIGLNACLAAVNTHAVQTLVLPAAGLTPGFACELCGALASTPAGCPHGPAASHTVPDLLEEMVAATLDDAGEVEAADDLPTSVVARLRFPQASAVA